MQTVRKHADRSGELNEDGSWPLSHVSIVGDPEVEWGVSDTYVAKAVQEGWLSFENPTVLTTEVDGIAYSRGPVLTGSEVVLDVEGGELRYEVLEAPGRYRDPAGGVYVTHEYKLRLRKGK